MTEETRFYDLVDVTIVRDNGYSWRRYNVHCNMSFEEIQLMYCKDSEVDSRKIYFYYGPNMTKIQPTDTPESLGLASCDVIEVHITDEE